MSEPIRHADFHLFRQDLREACGLNLAHDRFPQVSGTIEARMAELGLSRFSDYRQRLNSRSHHREELRVLAKRLTVGETYFFRHGDHWQALKNCVLPWILGDTSAVPRQQLRLWSAGCSTGEEAYTMAMVLSEVRAQRPQISFEILGTDLNPDAVDAAQRALFSDNSFRGVPPEVRDQYFENASPGRYRPRADLRECVRFEELNLLDATATARLRDFDVVFCRNVLIYFDESGKETVFRHLHDSLRPGGYLFLGHAEGVGRSVTGFAGVNVADTFLYKSVPGPVRPAMTKQRPCRSQSSVRPESPPRTPAPAPAPASVRRKLLPPPKPADAAPQPAPISARPAARQAAQATQPDIDKLRTQAIEQLCSEQTAEAKRSFEAVLQHSPADAGSLLGLSLLLAGQGDSEAAFRHCRQVLDADPLSAEACCAMALVHEEQGELSLAVRDLGKAVYLDDAFSIAHFRLACLYEQLSRPVDARREFRNTLSALPRDDESRVRLYSGGFDKATVARLCEQHLTRLGESQEPQTEDLLR